MAIHSQPDGHQQLLPGPSLYSYGQRHFLMQKFLIQNEFGQAQELIGEELVIPGFEDLQFILHSWLYDKHGGWAVTERSSGKRITSGPQGTEDQALTQLEYLLRVHGKEAVMRVIGRGPLTS